MYSDVSELKQIEKSCSISTCKMPFVYLWEQPLLQLGTWALRLLVVFVLFIAGFFVWKILQTIPQLVEWDRSVVTLLFLLLPINGARIGLSSARASVALALFALGVLLVCRRTVAQTILGLILITYTMFWDSFQVFALVALIPLVLADLARSGRISKYVKIVAPTLAGLALASRYPLKDLIVDSGFLAEPNGYNTIRPAFLMRAVLVGTLLSLPLAWQLFRSLAIKKSVHDFSGGLVDFGFFVLSLGTFPYLAVGHFANMSDWIEMWLPDNSDWHSRHQLLQGTGFAMIATALLKALRPQLINKFLITVICSCLIFNTSIFANYYVDGLKQRDIIALFRSQSEDLRGIEIFQIIDSAEDVNARGRGVRDYEFEGMITSALGRPVTIWESEPQTEVCKPEILGKTVVIQKISGRLKTLLTRGPIVTLNFSDLVACH